MEQFEDGKVEPEPKPKTTLGQALIIVMGIAFVTVIALAMIVPKPPPKPPGELDTAPKSWQCPPGHVMINGPPEGNLDRRATRVCVRGVPAEYR